jgi:hypothetical protein
VENILEKHKNKMQRSLAKHYDMFLKSTTVGKAIARKTKAFFFFVIRARSLCPRCTAAYRPIV